MPHTNKSIRTVLCLGVKKLPFKYRNTRCTLFLNKNKVERAEDFFTGMHEFTLGKMSCTHSRKFHAEVHKVQSEFHILKEATFQYFYMGVESKCSNIFGGSQK